MTLKQWLFTGVLYGLMCASGQAQIPQKSSAELGAQIAGLRLVPFCDLVSNTNAACDALVAQRRAAFGRFTGFSLDLMPDGSLKLTGQGALIEDFQNQAPWTLSDSKGIKQWVYQPAADGPRAEVLLDAPVFEGLPAGNFLRLCSANNQCVPYFLSTPVGVCALVTGAQGVNRVLLSSINQLQASNRQVTCP